MVLVSTAAGRPLAALGVRGRARWLMFVCVAGCSAAGSQLGLVVDGRLDLM